MAGSGSITVDISLFSQSTGERTFCVARLRFRKHEKISARRAAAGTTPAAALQQAAIEALQRLRQPSEVRLHAPGLITFPPRYGAHHIHFLAETADEAADRARLAQVARLLVELSPLAGAHGGSDHVWGAAWPEARTWLAFTLAERGEYGELVMGRDLSGATRLGLLARTGGLALLPDNSGPLRLITDQDTVVHGPDSFAEWEEHGWQTAPGRPVPHAELWRQLWDATQRRLTTWERMLPHHRLRLAAIAEAPLALD